MLVKSISYSLLELHCKKSNKPRRPFNIFTKCIFILSSFVLVFLLRCSLSTVFLKKKLNFFYLLQINIFLVFLDYFDTLISKIILKNKKNIILIYFRVKNTLKNNHNYTPNTLSFIVHVIQIYTNLFQC
jgi:hypothetical protein